MRVASLFGLLAIAAAVEPCPASVAHASPLAIACHDRPQVLYDALAWRGDVDEAARGEIIACTDDGPRDVRDLDRALEGVHAWPPRPLVASAHVYRVAYKTHRGNGAPAVGVASVAVPDHPRSGVAIVEAHGTRGLSVLCAPSHGGESPLAYASQGFVAIEPDYAGYGVGEAPPAWLDSVDEAASVLDAARAAERFVPEAHLSRVVLVGQSEGGHAVLSAQSLARASGDGDRVVGVIAAAPLWFDPRAFADVAMSDTPIEGPFEARLLSFALYYFYGHAELRDGPGQGKRLLERGARTDAKREIATSCAGNVVEELERARPAPSSLLAPALVAAFRACFVRGEGCDEEPVKTWRARFEHDLPKLDPAGAPVVAWNGGK
ncbi:MAG TPA: hypothetical protein VGM56_04485, partial [Byssovorax sp.]